MSHNSIIRKIIVSYILYTRTHIRANNNPNMPLRHTAIVYKPELEKLSVKGYRFLSSQPPEPCRRKALLENVGTNITS